MKKSGTTLRFFSDIMMIILHRGCFIIRSSVFEILEKGFDLDVSVQFEWVFHHVLALKYFTNGITFEIAPGEFHRSLG